LLLLLSYSTFTLSTSAAIAASHLSNNSQYGTGQLRSTISVNGTSSLPFQESTTNITVVNNSLLNLTAGIHLINLRPGQVVTPVGFVVNASQVVIVRDNKTVVSAPLQDKNKPLGINPQSRTPTINSWIIDSYYNYFSAPLTFMYAEWRVPSSPPTTGSTVFWFPGLQSNSHIIQPVLQWGPSSAGGGNYWILANWWAGCQGCTFYVSNYIQVYPGDLIYGFMSLSGTTWTIGSFDVTTNSGPNVLHVQDSDTYWDSVITLEGYSINTCDQFSGGVSFETIDLDAGLTVLTPSWGATDAVSGVCGLDQNDIIIRSPSQVILNTADPHWYSHSVPGAITLGGYFDITLTVRNLAGSDVQTAQLSFPSPISSVQITSTDMTANVYSAGSSVNGCYSSCTLTASYPFAEGSASFSTGQTHYITVRVYPSQVGVFTVYFKTVAMVNGVNLYFASDWDPTSGSTDQQGEYVNSFTLTVNSPPTVSVTVYSIDLSQKGQDPATQTDIHGSIFNNYQSSASTTTYTFNVPANTQITFSVSSNPNGWSFSNWWDDYGFTQYNSQSLTINVGSSNHKVAAFFTSFDFSMSNSGTIAIPRGGSGQNTITVTLTSGSTQSVSLSCSSGLPSGASCSFNPQSQNPTFTSTLTVSSSSSTPTGSYTITVTGTGGGKSRTTQFTLTVNLPLYHSYISPPSPPNGGTVTSSPVTLEVQITSDGGAVGGAAVAIYVDGPMACQGTSDASGYFSCSYSLSQVGHTYHWLAYAIKSGYSDIESGAWTFTYALGVQITVTSSPTGSSFVTVDGTTIASPHTFTWVVGSSHTLAANSPVGCGSGCRYVWTSWSDGGDQSHSISAPSSPTTYTANFKTQYYLTVTSPYGSPTPSSNWFDTGSISASVSSPVSGGTGTQYACTGWTGSGSVPATGSSCSTSFTINAPSSITWNWKTQYYLTVNSAYGSPNPNSNWFDAGTPMVASVSSPVSGGTGTRYVCTGWTGSGSVPSSGSTCSTNFNMNAPSGITWNWKTQYQLTITLDGHGTTTPLSGAWYDSGRSIIVTISSDGTNSSNTRYLISTITGSGGGSYSGSSNPFTVTMNAPITESVAWMTQYTLTVNLNGHGTSGPSSGNWYNSAASVQVTIGGDTSSNSSNTRYVYNGAAGSGSGSFTGSANPFTVTMNAPITESIVWQTQYMLTTIANPPTAGVVTPTSGWQNAGATVTIQATPNPDYSFVGWIGSGSGSFSGLGSPSITMNGPITETANFLMSTSISTSVSTSSISIASSVGLSGSITPNPSSVQVTLSLSIDSGSTWVTFMTVMTDGSGGYSTGWAPPYPGSFLLKASWSGNGQFAGSTSSPVSLTVIGSVTPTPTLLLFAPSTVSRSQLVTLSITVFNPTSSPLNANVTVQITGPSNYVSFDVIQIQVGASSQLTTYFDWTVPNQSGAYSVTVGLLQARPGGIDTGTIQPVTGTIQVT